MFPDTMSGTTRALAWPATGFAIAFSKVALGEIARSKDSGPKKSASGSRSPANRAISSASILDGMLCKILSVADKIATFGRTKPSFRDILAIRRADSTRVLMSGCMFMAASLIKRGLPPFGGSITKTWTSRWPTRTPASRFTRPLINISVCRLPLMKPATLPVLNRSIDAITASSSPVVLMISSFLSGQSIILASRSMIFCSPIRIGLIRFN